MTPQLRLQFENRLDLLDQEISKLTQQLRLVQEMKYTNEEKIISIGKEAFLEMEKTKIQFLLDRACLWF
ncbi:hypothetical protein [Xanthocytophaga agilis]|uniref:Uncharacterized protein n=1 Tax=Xanthocytophaga agilis TaxID=3048010 RepID=A0AAE3RD42_9BACT|nr:hypothetical protein [Xanthocytophaga agilis]MDJ1506134.1 hypothetical protein [Xanthocytophaga agilis]